MCISGIKLNYTHVYIMPRTEAQKQAAKNYRQSLKKTNRRYKQILVTEEEYIKIKEYIKKMRKQ